MTTVEASHVGRESPFVGLAAYDQDDADLFFGRDDERKVLISNLRASRLTLLYARSGTELVSRSRAQLSLLLRGCEPIEPGLVYTPEWRPGADDTVPDPSAYGILAVVARKP